MLFCIERGGYFWSLIYCLNLYLLLLLAMGVGGCSGTSLSNTTQSFLPLLISSCSILVELHRWEVVFGSLLWEAGWWNNCVLNAWIIKYEQTVPLKIGSSLQWSVELMWCFSITVAMLHCTCNKKHNWDQQNAFPTGAEKNSPVCN